MTNYIIWSFHLVVRHTKIHTSYNFPIPRKLEYPATLLLEVQDITSFTVIRFFVVTNIVKVFNLIKCTKHYLKSQRGSYTIIN